MKTIIFLFFTLPFLALAENSFKYIYDDKVYEIVSAGKGQYKLFGLDQSGKERRVPFNDKGNYLYSKEKLLGIFDLESDKTPYYKFRTETLEKFEKKDFENNLNEIAGLAPTEKLPAITGDTNPCAQIEKCKGQTGQEAYACLYKEMKGNQEYYGTGCKKLERTIDEKAFAPLRFNCTPEAMKHCPDQSSFDMYNCLQKNKNLPTVPGVCKEAIGKSQILFERMISMHFPTEQASPQPAYGSFGARANKTGISPSGATLRKVETPKPVRTPYQGTN